jgi:hypothetical protein
MDADAMKRYIDDAFDGVDSLDHQGDTFYFYDPEEIRERMHPFITIVTGDHYDTVSDLSRPGAYRINMGLTKARYVALLGAAPKQRDEHGVLVTDVDYAATDTLMPHPFYASQYWVSVVNPGEASVDMVRTLLGEAYEFAVRKHTRQRARRARS